MARDLGRPRRRRFRPLELLVVIDIIAVLIALALPAAQKVREAAALAESHDRIRRLLPVDRDGGKAASPHSPPESGRQGPAPRPRPPTAHRQPPGRQVRDGDSKAAE